MSLTATGFDRPRLNEIKTDYDERFTDALGPVNTNPDAVVGQIVAIFSAALDDAYEALQNTYDSMYPFSAEGVSLDGAVSFVGLTRLAAAPTTVTAMCYGTEGTLIAAGALARSLDNRQYVATADTVILRSSTGHAVIEVKTVADASTYQVITGGVSVVYTSGTGATAEQITEGLAALFNTSVFSASANAGKLTLKSADLYSDFTLTVESKLEITLLGTPVVFTALENGAYELPANSLTRIDSSILGWDEVNNLVPGDIGRSVETDEELRERHANSVRVTGAATAQAIRSRILAEVEGVTFVAVYENRTNVIDGNGLPSHSFETVVVGGSNQSVANKLFELKPAGIETYGNTSVQVYDENGDLQNCRFSRGVNKYAWIRVTINQLDLEEALVPEYETSIKEAVLAYGNSIDIGKDIIVQRFYGPIYSSTAGLGGITVELAVTGTPLDTPSYSTSNAVIARDEVVNFDLTRITVVGI